MAVREEEKERLGLGKALTELESVLDKVKDGEKDKVRLWE